MGGTTDAFGAAKQELLALLNWADDCADYIDQNISITWDLEKEICPWNKSVDSLNANASKLRAFKARETLGDIVKRVYEIIEIEHEEEKNLSI